MLAPTSKLQSSVPYCSATSLSHWRCCPSWRVPGLRSSEIKLCKEMTLNSWVTTSSPRLCKSTAFCNVESSSKNCWASALFVSAASTWTPQRPKPAAPSQAQFIEANLIEQKLQSRAKLSRSCVDQITIVVISKRRVTYITCNI